MKPTRIVLALALAVVAAPAFAQADDDDDMPKASDWWPLLAAPPAAPNALTAPPKSDAPSAAGGHGAGKLRDATGTPSMLEPWTWTKEVMDGDLKKPKGGLSAATLPQQSSAGAGAGKVQVPELGLSLAPRTTPPVPAVRFDVVGSPTEVINTHSSTTGKAKVASPALPQMQPGAPALRR